MAVINGTSGNDTLIGTADPDTFNPLHGSDTVDGLGGSDTLAVDYSSVFFDPFGGASVPEAMSSLVTSAGGSFGGNVRSTYGGHSVALTSIENLQIVLDGFNNVFVIDGGALAQGATASLDGSGGNDRLDINLSAFAALSFAVAANGLVTVNAPLTLANFENYRITSGAGNDQIVTGGGLDVIIAGAGNDLLDGGSSQDDMSGGAGDDVYMVDNQFDGVFENAGEGSDEIRTTLAAFSLVELPNVENLRGTLASGQALTGNSAANTVTGGDGNDVIEGGAGQDSLNGGNGNDTLYSHARDPAFTGSNIGISYDVSAETDSLNGGAGNDNLFAGYGDSVDGGGNDFGGDKLFISFLGAPAGVTADFRLVQTQGSINVGGGTITGIEETTFIEGSNFDDYLAGLSIAGSPIGGSIYGRGGNDQIIASFSSGRAGSALYGGDGNDTIDIAGAQFMPIAYGEAGDDHLIGGSNFDRLEGGDGNDAIEAFGGFDRLYGGGGNDVLDGGGDTDELYGDAGDDRLDGGSGNDQLEGGAGNDRLSGGSGDDSYSGGDGVDTLDFSGETGPVAVNLHSSLFFFPAGFPLATRSIGPGEALDSFGNYEAFSGIENLILSAGSDRVLGSDSGERIEGRGGIDGIQAMGGNDLVFGEGGNDVLLGNDGDDSLDGGADDDTLTGGAGADSLNGGDGTDTANYSQDGGNFHIIANLSGNTVFGEAGVVVLSGQARDSHGAIDNLQGIENFRTGATSDLVYGDSAANRIETGGGADYLTGGGGADTLIGGTGDDQYFIYAADSATFEDTIVELAGGGTDQIRTTLATFTLAAIPEVEYLIGTVNIAFTLTGNDGDNFIIGNASGDTLEGGLGNDWLEGQGGDDVMRGGGGDDDYKVEDIGDVVEENEGEGTDEVLTFLAAYSLLGTNVENLTAATHIAHDFRGSTADNVVTGGAAGDLLRLQDGGNDTAAGGAGNDVLYFGASFTGADVADGGEGRDTAILQGNYALTLSVTNLAGVESLSLQSGSRTNWGDLADNFYSYDITMVDANVAAGQQLIVNGQSLRVGEDFTFDGSAETDGFFLVYGGHGVDTLTGGAGNDTFFFEGARFQAGDRVDGGAGRDAVIISAGNGLTHIDFAADSLTGIEAISLNARYATDPTARPSYELVLDNGNVAPGATLIVNGGSLRDRAQSVSVDGSDIQDGNLIMLGGFGDDILIGGDGADRLEGGEGIDKLTGGAGADTFRYATQYDSTPQLPDQILDFVSGTDKIDLSAIDADVFAAGNQAFHWIGAGTFGGTGAGSAGELRAYQFGSDWYVEGDMDGNGAADLVIRLTAPPAPIVEGDFLF